MILTKSAGATRLVMLMVAAGAAGAGGAGSGCGLLDSDLTSVAFDLPPSTYMFDTKETGAKLPAATLPRIDCSDSGTCCALAQLASPGVNCDMVICDAATSTCALTATIQTPAQMVDLREAGGLSKFSGQSVIDVTISKITYDITLNTLNVSVPAIELFVAAQDATTPAHASAVKFGTVPPTMQGATPVGGTVVLEAAGQNAFKQLARNFGTPFVFMARTVVVVPGDTPLPMGGVSLTVKGQLRANAF